MVIVVTLFARNLNSSSLFWSTLRSYFQSEGIWLKESLFAGIDHCGVLASNRATEARDSVNSLVFVVIVIKNTDAKYLGRELNHGPIASVTSFSWTLPQL